MAPQQVCVPGIPAHEQSCMQRTIPTLDSRLTSVVDTLRRVQPMLSMDPHNAPRLRVLYPGKWLSPAFRQFGGPPPPYNAAQYRGSSVIRKRLLLEPFSRALRRAHQDTLVDIDQLVRMGCPPARRLPQQLSHQDPSRTPLQLDQQDPSRALQSSINSTLQQILLKASL